MMQKRMNNAVGHMAGKLWVMVMVVLVMICSCGANENDKQDLHENCLVSSVQSCGDSYVMIYDFVCC